MSFSGRTSPSTKKELKQLCNFFDNMNLKFARSIYVNNHPGIKLQALQRPYGFDVLSGPDCIDTKYDVLKKKENETH